MALEGLKHSNWRGYYYVIKNANGAEITIEGDTPEEVEAQVNKFLRKTEKDKQVKTTGNERPSYYKPLGRKKGGNRAVQTQRDLARIFGSVEAAINGGVVVAHARGIEWTANELLKRTLENVKYNNYTGNLKNSYKVTIIKNRRKVKEIYYDGAKKGVIKFGKKGGRFVELQRPTKHEFKGIKFHGKEGRYMRKWERTDGYRGKNSVTRLIDRKEPTWSGAKYGQFRAQSAIFLENTAPYAGAVQIGGRGYRVLSPAMRNKLKNKQETLVQLYVGKALRQAGLIR